MCNVYNDENKKQTVTKLQKLAKRRLPSDKMLTMETDDYEWVPYYVLGEYIYLGLGYENRKDEEKLMLGWVLIQCLSTYRETET